MKFSSRLLLIAVLLLPALAHSEDVVISDWLVAGPLLVPEPLFLDSAGKQDISRYLETDADYHEWSPASGQSIAWLPGESAEWQARSGEKLTWKIASATPSVTFAATYITSSRWQETEFALRASHPIAVWLDGKFIDKTTKATEKIYELKPTFTLHRGKHLLLVKLAGGRSLEPKAWTLEASASPDSAYASALTFSTDPKRAPAYFRDWGLFHEFSSPVISADSKLAAVIHSSRDKDYKQSKWLEVYDTRTSELVHTIRPGKAVTKPFFFPKSNKIGFVLSGDDGATIWSYDLTTHQQTPIVETVKGLEKIACSPDEQFLYYSTDEEESEAEQKSSYRHLDDLTDKVVDWTSKRRLHVVSLRSGVSHELTELGEFALDNFALSLEGDKLAFTRWVPKQGRPYYDSEIWVYDLSQRDAELAVSLALTEPPNNLTWLPGANQLAFTAGSHTVSPSDTVFPNTNHHPLYLLDVRSKQVTNLTQGQTFSIGDQGGRSSIFWSPRDQRLYFLATLGGTQRIMKLDPNGTANVSEVKHSRSLVDAYAVSADGSTLISVAAAPLLPFAVVSVNLNTGKETKLLDPNADVISQFHLASVEKWDFTNSDGDEIEGWLHFPPDFDASRQWPTIVYYYGGVSPRDERFTFTYHWWAANGYVVYVLNPVGSVGYGQAFADKHSNDWGTLATRDVIEGTQKLIAAKPYVDGRKLGAYGGSYGGFITLDLVTKTNLFAAAVDMYGISNIASYFGGGTWGHLYGDLALPGSYPWSHRDIFVEKSPLYHADKINTPLLILHGEADNNVPPVESDQMFAALKLLGRDVEYVRFKNETHNINVKFENLIEHREMMLEWFDKYLKDEPEGWSARWKENK